MPKISMTMNQNLLHLPSRSARAREREKQHKAPVRSAGQPKPTRHIVELAGVLAVILIVALAVVLGVFPELSADSGITSGANMIRLASGSGLLEAERLNAQGVAYLAKNRAKDALSCFRKAVAVDPQLIAAHNNLGTAMIQIGDRNAAREAFESTLKLQPKNEYAARQLEYLDGIQ